MRPRPNSPDSASETPDGKWAFEDLARGVHDPQSGEPPHLMADHVSFRTGISDHLRVDMHELDTFAPLLVIYDTDDDPKLSRG